MRGTGSIEADLKQLVYNTASGTGGAARYDALYKLFKEATSSEEQRRALPSASLSSVS